MEHNSSMSDVKIWEAGRVLCTTSSSVSLSYGHTFRVCRLRPHSSRFVAILVLHVNFFIIG